MRYNTLSPCYQCPDREVGCHSNCEKYIKFSTERETEREHVFKEKQKEGELIGYKHDRDAQTYWSRKYRK